MRYKYSIEEKELKTAFGDLLEIDEYDMYNDDASEFKKLQRGGQDHETIYTVTLSTMQHVQILLDYLSYDKSSWDYEPKLMINVVGTSYNFHRRGNYGHIGALEDGDMLIVCDTVRTMISDRMIPNMPRGNEDLRKGYISLLKSNEAMEEKANAFAGQITKLKEELAVAKSNEAKIHYDLPF